ncbi:MAG TPA: DNA polymerase III subunit delta, partial [Myxococcota bacterium]
MAKADSPEAFFSILEGDKALPAVVAFGGAERVFVDDALSSLRARVLSGGLADFNHDRGSARERRGVDIVAMCKTLPVMAPRRLVEIKDADSLHDADVEVLTAYLESPSPETVLVLVFGEVDLRSKLPKLLDKSKHALLCRFDHPKERDMPALVLRRAKKLQLKLDGAAADALAMTVGTDLTLLERALEKLAIAVEPGEAITATLVSTHVADTHLEDAFAFVRAVATADRKEAIRGAAQLQAAREEPLRLIGLLAWQLRQVAQARAMLDDGRDPAQELRLFGDRATPVLKAARTLSPERHAKRLVQLAEADVALKSSRQPPWLLMMRLINELT